MISNPGGAVEVLARGVEELLRSAADQFGARTAIVSDTGSVTWAELDAGADAITAMLAPLEPGPVVLTMPTGRELAAALFGCARAGRLAAPLPGDHPDPAGVADRLGAAVVLSPSSIPADCFVTAPRRTIDVSAGTGEHIAWLARAGTSSPVMLSHRALLAAVAAVGGTSHFVLRADDRVLQVLPMCHPAGWVTAFLPLTRVGAMAVVPREPEGPGEWLEHVLGAVRRHRVTVIPAAPSLYRRLRTAAGAERALASVRLLTSGAAPLAGDDSAAVRSVTGLPIWEGYGIAESASVAASSLMTPAPRRGSVGLPLPGVELRIAADDEDARSDDASAGFAPAGPPTGPATSTAELTGAAGAARGPDSDPARPEGRPPRIQAEQVGAAATEAADRAADDVATGDPAVHPDDSTVGDPPPVELPPARAAKLATGSVTRDDMVADIPGQGGVGRIALRGPTLFSGYWPDGRDGPDADGWFVTGDVGFIDDLGELHLVDRAAGAITVAGFTVYPREVEEALAAHPYVRDAAVIGVPGRAGEAVLAVLVAQRGTRPTPADLDEFLTARLPVFKRPVHYRLVERLPRTEVGRIDRDRVRADYLADPDPLSRPVHLAARPPVPDGPVPVSAVARKGLRLPGRRDRQVDADPDEDLF